MNLTAEGFIRKAIEHLHMTSQPPCWRQFQFKIILIRLFCLDMASMIFVVLDPGE